MMTSENCARTESIRYFSGGGEAIEPEGAIVDKFNYHMGRELGKMQHVVDSMSTFLYSPKVTFHFWDMFTIGCSVECDLHISKVGS